jgi:hypothetical protein
MFENGCTYKDAEKQFPSFYRINGKKINLLYQQVYAERLKKDPLLTIQKDTDLYKSRQYQIEIIEKRRTLKNLMKKTERNKEDDEDEDEDEDLHSCKQYKTKKDFESVLHNEIQKAIKRKSERDEPSEDSEEEDENEGENTEELIKEHQLKTRKFIRNTDDDSETEESEPRVILIGRPGGGAPPPG